METAGGRTRRVVMGVVMVVVVAFAARLEMVLRGAGLTGLYGYDDGVYYVGAASLVSGRWPYRDFVLLHPPGMLLVLAPFALLGRLTSDHVGFAAARLAIMLLSAGNAGAVAVLGARWRRPGAMTAALAGGLLAALWYSSIYASRTTLLEAPASTCLLVGLLLLWRRRRPVGPWAQLGAGAALGLSTTIKIWGVVPLLVVVAWQLGECGRRAAVRVLAGAATAAFSVCIVFFAQAPTQMTRMVVRDQLHRPTSFASPVLRGLDASSLLWNQWHFHLAGRAGTVAVVLAGVMLVVLCVVAWRYGGRLPVALLAACAVVLLLSPSYYTHYGELLTAPLALVVGAAAGAVAASIATRRRLTGLLALAVVPLLVLLALDLHTPTRHLGYRIDVPALRHAVAGRGCVAADEPAALAVLDVLTSDLRAGCPVPVDLTGATYDTDARMRPDGRAVPRLANDAWQRHLRVYLGSADVVVLAHSPRRLLADTGRAELARRPKLAHSGPVHVWGPLRRPAREAVAAPH